MASKFTEEDGALLDELGVEAPPSSEKARTLREERIISGFGDIQQFIDRYGRSPENSEHREIFERLFAVRLQRIRESEECRDILVHLDTAGLLDQIDAANTDLDDLNDDDLLDQLGISAVGDDITTLRHVRSAYEIQTTEDIAGRRKCDDFEKFKPLFDRVQSDLRQGLRSARPFVKDAGFLKAEIKSGQFFILGGQIAYVAKVGESFKAPNGEADARLRVIYSNGTESDLLLRSLQRALYKDEAGKRITEPEAGPLFTHEYEFGPDSTGVIYVLRSKSEHPSIAPHRDILHKIGVTGNDVARRIANARFDATFLMADVELVATYELSNINRSKLEALIHRIFGSARLDIEIRDRFDRPITPREWFMVPLFVINEAVARIKDGSITEYSYDLRSASLKLIDSPERILRPDRQ